MRSRPGRRKFGRDVVHRWEGNPVINRDDLTFNCHNMYNAGCIKIGKEYILLITIEKLDGRPAIFLAKSENGLHFEVAGKPFIDSASEEVYKEYAGRGVLDARITHFNGDYYIMYLSMSKHGFILNLGKTRDFVSFEKMGIISQPDTKAGALFSRKIGGKFVRLERPNAGGSIWITFSKDLLSWGESEVLLTPRPGYWDEGHIGCAVPPLEIEEGWLLLYYGVKNTSAGPLTRIGAALLSKNNPAKVISRSNIPILAPRELYERIGDINNVVFSCGAILDKNDELLIYYGGADNCICLGTVKLNDIIDVCMRSAEEF